MGIEEQKKFLKNNIFGGYYEFKKITCKKILWLVNIAVNYKSIILFITLNRLIQTRLCFYCIVFMMFYMFWN